MEFEMMKLGNLSVVGLMLVLFGVLILCLAFSCLIGAVNIPFTDAVRIILNKTLGIGDVSDIPGPYVTIVWELYAPRAFMGMVVGVGLALCGVVMQAMVQNPLADPYILGISSGASLGATFAFLIGTASLGGFLATAGVSGLAFIGSMSAAMAVFALAAVGGKITTTKMVLSGVIISSVCGAFSNLIVYLAPSDSGIRSLTFWLMGSLGTEGFDSIMLPAMILLVCVVFFLTQMRNLNAMMMGDETATTLGIDLSKLRLVYILLTSLLIAVLVCNCGIIGFVGLIIPHIARALVGTNHWKLLPISCLLGGIFMVIADIAARTITTSEIPIGIITAIVGTPIFAYIMIKKSYGFGEAS